jgi:hypothetical protein
MWVQLWVHSEVDLIGTNARDAEENDTVRYTAKQIKAKIARGQDLTNWDQVDAVAGKKLEASIRADVDDVSGEPDWTQAVMGIPAPKDHINIRIDHHE